MTQNTVLKFFYKLVCTKNLKHFSIKLITPVLNVCLGKKQLNKVCVCKKIRVSINILLIS